MFWANLNQQSGFILYQFFVACGHRIFGTDTKSLKDKVFVFLNPSSCKHENNFCSIVPNTTMLNGLQMGHMWSLQCKYIEFYFRTESNYCTKKTPQNFGFFSFFYLFFSYSGDLWAVLTSCLLGFNSLLIFIHSGTLYVSILSWENSRGMLHFLSLFLSSTLNICPRSRNYPETNQTWVLIQWMLLTLISLFLKADYSLILKGGVMIGEQMTVALPTALTLLLSEHNWLRFSI